MARKTRHNLKKGDNVVVTVEEVINDCLIVSFLHHNKKFSGALMDTTKRNGPYGIPGSPRKGDNGSETVHPAAKSGNDVRSLNGKSQKVEFPQPLLTRKSYKQNVPQPPQRQIFRRLRCSRRKARLGLKAGDKERIDRAAKGKSWKFLTHSENCLCSECVRGIEGESSSTAAKRKIGADGDTSTVTQKRVKFTNNRNNAIGSRLTADIPPEEMMSPMKSLLPASQRAKMQRSPLIKIMFKSPSGRGRVVKIPSKLHSYLPNEPHSSSSRYKRHETRSESVTLDTNTLNVKPAQPIQAKKVGRPVKLKQISESAQKQQKFRKKRGTIDSESGSVSNDVVLENQLPCKLSSGRGKKAVGRPRKMTQVLSHGLISKLSLARGSLEELAPRHSAAQNPNRRKIGRPRKSLQHENNTCSAERQQQVEKKGNSNRMGRRNSSSSPCQMFMSPTKNPGTRKSPRRKLISSSSYGKVSIQKSSPSIHHTQESRRTKSINNLKSADANPACNNTCSTINNSVSNLRNMASSRIGRSSVISHIGKPERVPNRRVGRPPATLRVEKPSVLSPRQAAIAASAALSPRTISLLPGKSTASGRKRHVTSSSKTSLRSVGKRTISSPLRFSPGIINKSTHTDPCDGEVISKRSDCKAPIKLTVDKIPKRKYVRKTEVKKVAIQSGKRISKPPPSSGQSGKNLKVNGRVKKLANIEAVNHQVQIQDQARQALKKAKRQYHKKCKQSQDAVEPAPEKDSSVHKPKRKYRKSHERFKKKNSDTTENSHIGNISAIVIPEPDDISYVVINEDGEVVEEVDDNKAKEPAVYQPLEVESNSLANYDVITNNGSAVGNSFATIPNPVTPSDSDKHLRIVIKPLDHDKSNVLVQVKHSPTKNATGKKEPKRLSGSPTHMKTDKYLSNSPKSPQSPKSPPPSHSMDVTRGKSVNGVIALGDIVWGKLAGYPWWPSRVLRLRVTKTEGETLQQDAMVAWFHARTTSVIPLNNCLSFTKYFNTRFEKRRKGVYTKAVRDARNAVKEITPEVRKLISQFET